MALKNEAHITEREWDALVRVVERNSNGIEQLERERLVFKAKMGVWVGIISALSGLGATLVAHFVIEALK